MMRQPTVTQMETSLRFRPEIKAKDEKCHVKHRPQHRETSTSTTSEHDQWDVLQVQRLPTLLVLRPSNVRPMLRKRRLPL